MMVVIAPRYALCSAAVPPTASPLAPSSAFGENAAGFALAWARSAAVAGHSPAGGFLAAPPRRPPGVGRGGGIGHVNQC